MGDGSKSLGDESIVLLGMGRNLLEDGSIVLLGDGSKSLVGWKHSYFGGWVEIFRGDYEFKRLTVLSFIKSLSNYIIYCSQISLKNAQNRVKVCKIRYFNAQMS